MNVQKYSSTGSVPFSKSRLILWIIHNYSNCNIFSFTCSCRHPNIISIYGDCATLQALVLEYADKGSLHQVGMQALVAFYTQSTYIYRVQSSVWRLPNYWPPTPSPPSKCVLTPPQGGWGGGHTRSALRKTLKNCPTRLSLRWKIAYAGWVCAKRNCRNRE